MTDGEGGAVDVLHQLRQRLGEEGQIHLIPDVVLRPLQQVQQRLQKGLELCVVREGGKEREERNGRKEREREDEREIR